MRKLAGLLIFVLLCGVIVSGATGCRFFRKKQTQESVDQTPIGGIPGEEIGGYPAIGDFGAGVDAGETSYYPEMPRMPADMQVPELRTVYFAFDSSNLDAQAQQVLEGNAQYLQLNPTLTVQVEGHCDERGTREYNYALGQRRADSVREYLIQRGIEPTRLNPISYGEDRPVAPGSGEEAWAQNRRVQFMSY